MLCDTGSSNLWVPNSDCCDGSQVTIFATYANQAPTSPTAAQFKIEHDSGPVSGFYSKDTMNIGGCVSITDYTLTEVIDVSGLGISCSLENLTESAAWLDVSTSLFHFENEVRTPVEGLVGAGAEPVFASTLKIKSMTS